MNVLPRIRSPLLCPLSYGRIRLMYSEFSPPGSSRKPQLRQCGSTSVLNARSQRVVHGLGQAAVHTLDDVGVGVEGDENAGVAEEFLNIVWVLVCHEEYCSAGVAEFVDPGLDYSTFSTAAFAGGSCSRTSLLALPFRKFPSRQRRTAVCRNRKIRLNCRRTSRWKR